jgi:hypothetical protein
MTKSHAIWAGIAIAAGLGVYAWRKAQAAKAAQVNNTTEPILPEWWTFAGNWSGSVS